MSPLRTRSQLITPAPPPSPIPTGAGSRSAANKSFIEFLEKSNQLPHLELPESHFRATARDHSIPDDIDLRSLGSPGNGESIARILRSSKELGAFRITNHGVSAEELRSFVKEAERVFQDSYREHESNFVEHDGDRERILWIRSSRSGKTESETQFAGAGGRYYNFSERMEKVAEKLEGVAEQVIRAMCKNDVNGERVSVRGIQMEKENVVSVYRYNHDNPMERRPPLTDHQQRKSRDHALCLHIPLEHCQFFVQSARGPQSFDAGTDSIVATIGKQLEEWSHGQFKCVSGEVIFMPDLHGTQDSLSIELEYSCSNLNQGLVKTVSVGDQILIALILPFIYRISVFLFSRFIQNT